MSIEDRRQTICGMSLLPLSLIKGEYGWNVTLKRVDKQTGGRRGSGFSRGECVSKGSGGSTS